MSLTITTAGFEPVSFHGSKWIEAQERFVCQTAYVLYKLYGLHINYIM